MKRRFKVTVQYIGDRYRGMQKQSHTKLTIQETLENVLSKITNEKIEIRYAGRTDSGVSATGQVIDFLITNQNIEIKNILKGSNSLLKKEDITLIDVEEVNIDFNSRFDAISRTYKYFIHNHPMPFACRKMSHLHIHTPLNINKMLLASRYLLGKHDFTSFSKKSPSNIQNPIRTIELINIEKTNNDFEIIITIKGKSFLHNMVRIIVGTLIEAGIESISSQDVKFILDAKDRKMAKKTVSPNALYFWDVEYKNGNYPLTNKK